MRCNFAARHWSGAIAVVASLLCLQGCDGQVVADARSAEPDGSGGSASSPNETVELTEDQLRAIAIQPVTERAFAVEREAIGNIDFNQDMTVQVSPPYQGRIVQLLSKTGDRVRKGQILFAIESPDLVQAESTLISSSGVLKLATSVLERARGLYAIQGIAQKDYEQAISDQQAAEAAYKAARDAVRIFGKTDSEMDRIVQQRHVDAKMPVPSPITGVVTARSAAPGALVQPGGNPAPYTIADLTSKWLLAEVQETDLPALRLDQTVDVSLLAYPGKVFHGRITNIAEGVDPNTHRATVRSEVNDPNNELRPQMFATFTVHIGEVTRAPAVPTDAIVREGDGTLSVWTTIDGHRFTRRTVQIGAQQDGFDQITGGVRAGERIAATGALFLSNASIQGAAS